MELPPVPPLQELKLVEGDEEVQYVFVELPLNVPDSAVAAGAQLTLRDLDSDAPTVVLADGTELLGEYEEPLGSIMLYRSNASGESVRYVGHSESVLSLQAAAMPPREQAQQQTEAPPPNGVQAQGDKAAAVGVAAAASPQAEK